MPRGKLTDAKIRALRSDGRDRFYGDGGGLWLRVRASGAKVWIIRSKRHGRARVVTLGPYPAVSLREARRRAEHFDPAAPRGPATVAELAEEWHARIVVPRYRRPDAPRGFLDRGLIPHLGHRRLDTLSRADVAASVREYATRGPVAANRYLATVKRVLAYGVEAGYLETSPAAALTRRLAGGPEVSRARVLTDEEIRALWRSDGPHAPLCRFLLLTAARIGEAQRARWRDVDGTRWTIPERSAKSKRAHWVHLPALALELVGPARGERAWLIRRRAVAANVQAWVRRHCDATGAERWTPHDLRRTAATRMNELGIAPHVVEKCLAHRLQGVMAVYNRAEYAAERVDAAERWAAEVARIVNLSP